MMHYLNQQHIQYTRIYYYQYYKSFNHNFLLEYLYIYFHHHCSIKCLNNISWHIFHLNKIQFYKQYINHLFDIYIRYGYQYISFYLSQNVNYLDNKFFNRYYYLYQYHMFYITKLQDQIKDNLNIKQIFLRNVFILYRFLLILFQIRNKLTHINYIQFNIQYIQNLCQIQHNF